MSGVWEEPNDADAIARVVADLRDHRVRSLGDVRIHRTALRLIDDPTVVNATAIYHSLADNPRPVYMYEDHPCISPPWEEAAICYRNEHGNVIVMHITVGGDGDWLTTDPASGTDNPVDWDRVRWRLWVFVYVGGRGNDGTEAVPTSGPAHLWQMAVYEDGEPADLHWVRLKVDYPIKHWDMAHLVVLGALNFLNCRNVERGHGIRGSFERAARWSDEHSCPPDEGREARGDNREHA